MKQVTCTFNFDPETEAVSDLKCFIDGVEKVKKRTVRSKKETEVMEDTPLITLDASKLMFNNKAIADMNIEYQNRIIIKYIPNPKNKKLEPFIGKDTDWDEEGAGNKITKTNSISYRGKPNSILAEFGTEFTIKETDEGVWELISLNGKPKDIQEVQETAEEIIPDLYTEDDNDTELDEIQFTL